MVTESVAVSQQDGHGFDPRVTSPPRCNGQLVRHFIAPSLFLICTRSSLCTASSSTCLCYAVVHALHALRKTLINKWHT